MKEEVLQFGPGRHLLGVLSRPERVDPSLPAVLISNTGLAHNVAPNRIHVHLCRAIAESGYCALRLDLGGLGDSSLPPGRGPNPTLDLQAAMGELERRALARRFIVVGLCSAAHDAHQVTAAEPRVAGAVFLDGYAYPTPHYRLRRQIERLLDPKRSVRFLRDRLRGGAATVEQPVFRAAEVDLYVRPPQAQTAADYREFMRRQLQLCFVYTGGLPGSYNYRGQFLDAFPLLKDYAGCEIHYFRHADHTFTRREMRAELVQLLLRWLKTRFPPAIAPAG